MSAIDKAEDLPAQAESDRAQNTQANCAREGIKSREDTDPPADD
jgi:hypothetical protein